MLIWLALLILIPLVTEAEAQLNGHSFIGGNWKWVEGRQGTGYQKLLVAQGSWWDCWLIWYGPQQQIPLHTDPVADKQHHRLNIRLWGPDTYRGQALVRWWRFCYFRPDIMPHFVVRDHLLNRTRCILSIGWVREGVPSDVS